MYVLETDPIEAVESIYIIELIEIIKAYVLETDPYRGCIKHGKKRKNVKVYVLKADLK